MVKAQEVRLYIEGGGNADSRKKLRKSFRIFLEKGDETIKRNRSRLQIIFCGSKTSTFEDFQKASSDPITTFDLLLVDSDGSKDISQGCLQYLGLKLKGVDESQCHLMVQEMEAWLISDTESLRRFYGSKFKKKVIRKSNVEQIDQPKEALKKACQNDYHEIDDAASLLEIVDVAKVRQAAPHCERLFQTLTEKMN